LSTGISIQWHIGISCSIFRPEIPSKIQGESLGGEGFSEKGPENDPFLQTKLGTKSIEKGAAR
jgi:hypothetical protein